MSAMLMRHLEPALQRDALQAMRKRAWKAARAMLVSIGVPCAWQTVSSDRAILRAERAQRARLQLTPQKLQILARDLRTACRLLNW
jgi:hypothetical protein